MPRSEFDSPLAGVAEEVLRLDGSRHDWDGPALLFTLRRGSFGQAVLGPSSAVAINPRELNESTLTTLVGALIDSDAAYGPPCGVGIRYEGWSRSATSPSLEHPLPGRVADQLDAVEISMCTIADMHGNTHSAFRTRTTPDRIQHSSVEGYSRLGQVLSTHLTVCAAGMNALHHSDLDTAAHKIVEALRAAELARPAAPPARRSAAAPQSGVPDAGVAHAAEADSGAGL
ncbi:hypothetical protein [Nocardia suismassiliense]|uniref:hypothetical protein n=1 Tax=Nocardia suismassiliense TaxID=2077092 RepID=UPI00131EE0CE|nr:hypothetical protein [Nocardia suismassiliense]